MPMKVSLDGSLARTWDVDLVSADGRAGRPHQSESKDGRHQMGATRMGETPKTGMVDKDCRVFGVANFFVTGT